MSSCRTNLVSVDGSGMFFFFSLTPHISHRQHLAMICACISLDICFTDQKLAEEVERERKLTEEARNQAEKELERQKIQQEKEQMEKEDQRRKEAKRIFAEKIRPSLIDHFRDWTLVPCPGGDVPTSRPDLIQCGPGNQMTLEKGGNLSPIQPGRARRDRVARNGDVAIKDFSKLKFFPEGWEIKTNLV